MSGSKPGRQAGGGTGGGQEHGGEQAAPLPTLGAARSGHPCRLANFLGYPSVCSCPSGGWLRRPHVRATARSWHRPAAPRRCYVNLGDFTSRDDQLHAVCWHPAATKGFVVSWPCRLALPVAVRGLWSALKRKDNGGAREKPGKTPASVAVSKMTRRTALKVGALQA